MRSALPGRFGLPHACSAAIAALLVAAALAAVQKLTGIGATGELP